MVGFVFFVNGNELGYRRFGCALPAGSIPVAWGDEDGYETIFDDGFYYLGVDITKEEVQEYINYVLELETQYQ
ncbi:MAG: hypothetical protein GX889_12350 [Clostridiales bacterium]|nr:hypothetical protein [Clostridiales bacterium]